MKRFLTALLCGALLLQPVLIKAAPEAGTEAGAEESHTAGPEVSSPSAFLAEASTGKVIYEKNSDEKCPPASVTKIMTLLLALFAVSSAPFRRRCP